MLAVSVLSVLLVALAGQDMAITLVTAGLLGIGIVEFDLFLDKGYPIVD